MCTRLLGVATDVPPYVATQQHTHNFLREVIKAREPAATQSIAVEFLDAISESCAIDQRHVSIADYTRNDPEDFTFFPKNWRLDPFPSTQQRMEIYEAMSFQIAHNAAQKALDDSGIHPEQITHLIVVTCTGLYAPGPDILLVKSLGLRPTTRRTIIGFMGCYGAFNGLRAADQIIRAEPDAVVLQVCVELCSLHYQISPEPDVVIGNCLFADGAAAAIYGSSNAFDMGLADIRSTHCEISHNSLEQMQWHIGDTGFSMVLDARIPGELFRGGPAFINDVLTLSELPRDAIKTWVVHPGGPRIIDAIRDAANIDETDVQFSRDVLKQYGNMSSATVMFVLNRQLQAGFDDHLMMLGFGPGLTMEGAVLDAIM